MQICGTQCGHIVCNVYYKIIEFFLLYYNVSYSYNLRLNKQVTKFNFNLIYILIFVACKLCHEAGKKKFSSSSDLRQRIHQKKEKKIKDLEVLIQNNKQWKYWNILYILIIYFSFIISYETVFRSRLNGDRSRSPLRRDFDNKSTWTLPAIIQLSNK